MTPIIPTGPSAPSATKSTQTFWLSFADHNRPVGHQFLGAALVEVTEADVALAMPFLNQRREAFGLPPADEEACWLAGAIHKSHQLGCNPGGEVASVRL